MDDVIIKITKQEAITLYTILLCYSDGAPVSEKEDSLRYKIMDELSKYV